MGLKSFWKVLVDLGCSHNYVFTQGYFVCTKCGKRSYGFYDDNKRTGVVSSIKLTYDNGYDLGIDPEAENSELREMLIKIKQHYRNLDMKTVAQMSFYISERIKPL